MKIEPQIVVVACSAFWLGVCAMALVQNWRAKLGRPIPAQLVPRRLVESCTAPLQIAERRPNGARTESAPTIDSPFAPKRKPKLPRIAPPAPALPRAARLAHWPTPVAEREKPPAMIEARPRARFEDKCECGRSKVAGAIACGTCYAEAADRRERNITAAAMRDAPPPPAPTILPYVEFGK